MSADTEVALIELGDTDLRPDFDAEPLEDVCVTDMYPNLEDLMSAAKPLLIRLNALAHRLTPGMRKKLASVTDGGDKVTDVGAYFSQPLVAVRQDLETAWGENIGALADFFDLFNFEELRLASEWPGEPFPKPEGVDPFLFELEPDVVCELLRQKLFVEESRVEAEYEGLRAEFARTLNIEGLDELISRLESVPTTIRQVGDKAAGITGSLDFPASTSPQNTRLDRALRALRNDLDRDATGNNVQGLVAQTRRFVLGVLNPQKEVEFLNVTDVYGSESENPEDGELDATRIRVYEHRKEIEGRYGVKLEVFDQGTSILCPEQCGFNVLVALNQARRADLDKRIESRFVVLNNAARLTEADGIEGGAAAAASSSLLYFSFDLGDGVLHHGVAYGQHTLTFLKPYITEIYEIEGTDRGSQFRSLEYEQHVATLSAMADGALPACYQARQLQVSDAVPDLKLKPNQAMLIGRDKFGNGLLATKAGDWIDAVLCEEETHREVGVRFFSRQMEPYCETGNEPAEHKYETYVLARNLGAVRGGQSALWTSSTPTTANPKEGYLSIGVFKANRGDVNEDVLDLEIGDIVEIAIGDETVN